MLRTLQTIEKTNVIGQARLRNYLERADTATERGVFGPFQMDHGQLTGFVIHEGQKHLTKELFATGHYVKGNAALRCTSSADPETMRELIRGYVIAKNAGLL